MPNFTPNLNLEKPLQTEFYNVDVPNANMDKIDTSINAHISNMAQHNQILDGTQKKQLIFGINRTLNCLTIDEVNI